tara:strand:+ start:99 stop:449 length:351 start_codon:yes stop_codon:yes gene_type:complete
MKLLYVFLGGGIGSIIRYLISVSTFQYTFPVATFLVNLVSCIIYGLVISSVAYFDLNKDWNLLLLVGLCGGLSTFSAFSFETLNLIKDGYVFYAILNIVFSISLCCGVLYFFSKRL